MYMRRIRGAMLVMMLGLGSIMLSSCPVSGLLGDCYGDNTISRSEYEDLGTFRQWLYEENWCGRYSRNSDFLGDLFD